MLTDKDFIPETSDFATIPDSVFFGITGGAKLRVYNRASTIISEGELGDGDRGHVRVLFPKHGATVTAFANTTILSQTTPRPLVI